MYGYQGKILRINLSNRTSRGESLSEGEAKRYLGGRGLAVKLLFEELRSGIDPLEQENKLVYAAGPFAGTGFPLNSRWMAAAKSPQTRIWGESTCGGTFAVQLRKAGYDALVIEGVSEAPVYVTILDDEVEIREAADLWGKMTLDTEIAIAADLGIRARSEDNPAVACIGPAGENLVKIAAIIHTAHRAAGRTGLGAVMGSKRLKAIAIRGSKRISVAQPERLKDMIQKVVSECLTNETIKNFTRHGQPGNVRSLQEMGMLPTKNFQRGTFEGSESITGERMTETILKARNTCSQCPVACKREVEVSKGPYAPVDPRYGGPEYENVAALGSLLLIADLQAISKENEMCNAYGLDAISTGTIIAWVMECYDRGILTKADLDGIEARWSDVDAALKLIKKIAAREGVGDILAEGVKKAAEHFGRGCERYAVHVKGLEIPMHEPRAKKGLGLSYAVSSRGGCHLQAYHDPMFESPNLVPEIGIVNALDRHDTSKEKVNMIIRSQDWIAITNSLLWCTSPGWAGYVYTRPTFVTEVLNAITGWDMSVEDLMLTGERMNNLCRCFNAREGMSRMDDYLPPRFTEDTLPDGPSRGHCVSKEQLDDMLDNYYSLRGWDEKTGNPTKEKLNQLGLTFVYL